MADIATVLRDMERQSERHRKDWDAMLRRLAERIEEIVALEALRRDEWATLEEVREEQLDATVGRLEEDANDA